MLQKVLVPLHHELVRGDTVRRSWQCERQPLTQAVNHADDQLLFGTIFLDLAAEPIDRRRNSHFHFGQVVLFILLPEEVGNGTSDEMPDRQPESA